MYNIIQTDLRFDRDVSKKEKKERTERNEQRGLDAQKRFFRMRGDDERSALDERLQIGATSNDAFVIVYNNQVVGAENSSRRYAAGILTQI